MNISSAFKNVFWCCLLILFCGCKANLEWYLRNTTDQDVLLTLRYEKRHDQYRPNHLPLKSKYVDFKKEILKIDYETSSKLTDSLKILPLSDSTYQIELPAKSTTDFTYIIPTDYGHDINVILEFDQGGKKFAINTINVFKKPKSFKMAGTLTLKNLIYYDYEDQ